MVIFHSYIKLPEGNMGWSNEKKTEKNAPDLEVVVVESQQT